MHSTCLLHPSNHYNPLIQSVQPVCVIHPYCTFIHSFIQSVKPSNPIIHLCNPSIYLKVSVFFIWYLSIHLSIQSVQSDHLFNQSNPIHPPIQSVSSIYLICPFQPFNLPNQIDNHPFIHCIYPINEVKHPSLVRFQTCAKYNYKVPLKYLYLT